MIIIMQIIPSANNSIDVSVVPYLISAIVAEASVIIFLALYIKKLSKLKDEVYQYQVKDHKDIIDTNTEALVKNAVASEMVADVSKDVAKAVNDLRIWLADKMK